MASDEDDAGKKSSVSGGGEGQHKMRRLKSTMGAIGLDKDADAKSKQKNLNIGAGYDREGEKDVNRDELDRVVKDMTDKRMLRIEFKGNIYDWFDLNDAKTFDLQRHEDFLGIVQHNIWQYYFVPPEAQELTDG